MSEESSGGALRAPDGPRVGSWLGAAASAFGIAACITIVTLGGMATMDLGGFVASGGPYAIAHPAPAGFWILPVAFVGLFLFPVLHSVFASRIKGFALVFATWCALWTAIGGTTFYYGFKPPGGGGLAWGWLVMGAIFLAVGLVSTVAYVLYLVAPARERSGMPRGRLTAYALMTAVMLAAGVFVGVTVFAAVVG